VNSLDQILTIEGMAYLVGLARAAGVVIVAPMPWSYAPARARVALVLMLGLAVEGAPMATGAEALAPFDVALRVGSELILGIAMGMVVRFAIAAAEMIGEMVAPMIGLGVAQVFDPGSSSSENVLSMLIRSFAIWIAISVGIHRELMATLIMSFQVIPAGATINAAGGLEPLLALSSMAIVTATRLALPIIAVLLITQLALALVARAAPAMQVFNVGFSVTLVVGWLILILTLPDIHSGLAADFSHVGSRIEHVLASFWVGP
jgi:flagellar biosynthesis protein FliR